MSADYAEIMAELRDLCKDETIKTKSAALEWIADKLTPYASWNHRLNPAA